MLQPFLKKRATTGTRIVLGLTTLCTLSTGLFFSCRKDDSSPGASVTTTPTPAAAGVLASFDRYQVVAISELHYNQEVWNLVDEILKHPDVPNQVTNFAFEGGNASYQDLMDRYVNGENISEEEIKKVWRNNTQISTTYDAPVYLRFINRVRERNQKLPPAKKLRIVLLDPPIDWAKVTDASGWLPYIMDREPNMVKVIEKEVYGKNGKLLFVAGAQHVDRSLLNPYLPSALTALEKKHLGTTFSIATYSGFGLSEARLQEIETKFAAWPKPGIALLKGTWIGETEAGINTRVKGPDGKVIDPYPGLEMQDIHDAIIFLGKRWDLTTSDPSKNVCTGTAADQAWMGELLRRQEVVSTPPPLRKTPESLCKPLPLRYFDQEIFR